MEIVTWAGMGVCLAHSAMFSGLNLALFGLTRLRLEVEASAGNHHAERILHLRKDAHFLLTTILWGNVAFNTLLALLSNSVLAGVYAFVFSTFFITFFGEIIPQAYFSRHALRMGSLLVPAIRFYQILLYPLAKTTALLLDRWLGREGISYFREHQLREVIQKHIEADEADVDRLEGLGALNFLALDDLPVFHQGEPLDPASVIALPARRDIPEFPAFARTADDPFLRKVQGSGRKWIVLTDERDRPLMVMDADGFLRKALFEAGVCDPLRYCHRPVVVTDEAMVLGDILHHMTVEPVTSEDDVIDKDIILFWSRNRRIITGADILGRLLRGIVVRKE
jgi:metal transporter CNNM